jgi:hypothetical protein
MSLRSRRATFTLAPLATILGVLALATPALARPPENTVPPIISGSPVVGETLVSTSGEWEFFDEPLVNWEIDWQRCEAPGECETIEEPYAEQYKLRHEDLGYKIRTVVTTGRPGEFTTAVSEEVGPVTASDVTEIEATGTNATLFIAENGVNNTTHHIHLTAYAHDDTHSATGLIAALNSPNGSDQSYEVFEDNGTTPVTGAIVTNDLLQVVAESGTSQDYQIVVEPPASLCKNGTCEKTFAANNECATQSFVVPNGVSAIGFNVVAAGGGGTEYLGELPASGGPGGSTSGTAAVSGGSTLKFNIGTGGTGNGGSDAAAGGCFGGGTVDGGGEEAGAAGGGGSYLFEGAGSTVIAAAGGGGGATFNANGGAGGNPGGDGAATITPSSLPGGGAAANRPGAGGTSIISGEPGEASLASISGGGSGGDVVLDSSLRSAGAGGGGYYGGGSGASDAVGASGAGGGGSDFALFGGTYDSTRANGGLGAQDGDNGRVTLTFPQVTTTTTLTPSKTTVKTGEKIKLNAIVTPTPTSVFSGETDGIVNFSHNGIEINGCEEVAVSVGAAECETDFTTVGATEVEAEYIGSSNKVYKPSPTDVKLIHVQPATTATPTLLAPTAGERTGGPLTVQYSLPEEAETGTVTLTFSNENTSSVTTAQLSDDGGAGEHTVSINIHDLQETPGLVSSETELAPGTYTVSISYQNTIGDPAASESAANVAIITATSVPTIIAPITGAYLEGSFQVIYDLPEAAQVGSVTLKLTNETSSDVITLTNRAAGVNSVNINPVNIFHILQEPKISGATPNTITTGEYTLTVEYQNELGDPVATSPSREIMIFNPTELPPRNQVAPTLSGHWTVGETMEATSVGTWTGTEPISYEYQWELCILETSTCHDIASATEAGYEIASTDVSKLGEPANTLRLKVKGINTFGEGVAYSGRHDVVAQPAALASPTLSGEAKEGQELTINATITGLPTPSTSYEWQRCNTVGVDCLTINGANTATYTLTSPDVGSTIRALVNASNAEYIGGGEASSETVPTSIVTAIANPCDLGYYSSTGSEPCTAAQPGHYVHVTGATQQLECVPGTYSSQSGATECTIAQPGSYAAGNGATQQTECAAGTYSETAEAASCKKTPVNTYAAAGATTPTACPTGTEAPEGASSCTTVPKPEAPTETKIVTHTTPETEHEIKVLPPVHATPRITNASINHRCIAPSAVKLGGTVAKSLALSYTLNEPAALSYTISRHKGSPDWSYCPASRGNKPGRYEKVWTGQGVASKGKNTIGVATAARNRNDAHRVTLHAVLAAAHVNATKLRPGTYVLTIVATTPEGKQSTPVTIKFWVVRTPRKHRG